jgi:hypothetical protein
MAKLKYLLSMIAVILAVAGVFAMKANKNVEKRPTIYYYEYTSEGTNLSDYQTAGNWQAISSPDDADCSGGNVPCVVHSSQSTVSSFVSSITSTSVVTNNEDRSKD